MAFLAGLGFFQYIFRVGNSTLIQTIVPDALRGRVMSIYMVDNGLTPLATMAASFFIHIWSSAREVHPDSLHKPGTGATAVDVLQAGSATGLECGH